MKNRRLFAILTALCLSVCLLAVTASAAEIASGTCGPELTWTLTEDGTMTISGTGGMDSYASWNMPWYDYQGQIKSVVVEEGVTAIGRCAFIYSSVEQVTLPDTLTTINEYGFEYCENLKQIDLPENLYLIGKYAFAGCTSLTSVQLPASATELGDHIFRDCSSLTGIWVDENNPYYSSDAYGVLFNKEKTNLIQLPHGISGSYSIPDTVVTVKDWGAYSCNNLVSVTIPAGVTSVGDGFLNACTSLQNIDVDENNAYYCNDAQGALYSKDKTSLIRVGAGTEGTFAIPDTVVAIGDRAFAGNEKLTGVTIPGSVESIGNFAFGACSALTEVVIPEGVVSIDDFAFNACTSLKTVDIASTVASIGENTFRDSVNIETVYFRGDAPEMMFNSFYSVTGNAYYPGDNATWTEEVMSNCGGDMTWIWYGEKHGTAGENVTWVLTEDGTLTISGTGAMSDYHFDNPWEDNEDKIINVVVEDGITRIGDYAFYTCSNMTSISLPDSLKDIGSFAFYRCTSLTDVVIPDSVEQLGNGVFENCRGLISVKLPAGLTAIPDQTFSACASLSSIEIPDSVTSIGRYAFYTCKSLGEIEISENVTSIGDFAIIYCSSLSGIHVDEDNAVYSSDQSGVLYNKDKTDMIAAPGVLSGLYEIPDGVTSISLYAFQGCENLTGVVIPGSVTSLEYGVFSQCFGMTGITFKGDAPAFASNVFYEITTTVYYPGNNATWTSDVMQDYDGVITWVPYSAGIAAPEVKASNVASTGKIKLSWNAVEGAANYKVYRATSKSGTYKLLKTTTSTSFTNTGAVAGSTYYYYVVAVAEDGAKSEASAIVSRTCDYARPVVKVTNVASTGKIKLTWDAVDGATSYKIYRSTIKGSTGSLIKTTTSTSFTNTSAEAGTLYYYQVMAVGSKSAANSAKSTTVSRTCDLPRPTVTLTNVASSGKIKVSWEAVEGAVSYKVYRATSSGGTYTLLKTVTGTSFTNTSAKAGTTYYYKVIAVHSRSAANSAYSSYKSRTCDLPRPDVSIALNNRKPKLTWDAVEGAVSYKIYRSTTKDGTYSLIKITTANYYRDTTTKSGRIYYYKVVAVHTKSAANSAYSLVDYILSK